MKKLLVLLLIFVLAGCAGRVYQENLSTTVKSDSVAVDQYEQTALILRGIYEQAMVKCSAGKISSDGCSSLRALYNSARDAFIRQGDELKKQIQGKPNDYDNASTEFRLRFKMLQDEADKFEIKRGDHAADHSRVISSRPIIMNILPWFRR